jgi:hypothetical protein
MVSVGIVVRLRIGHLQLVRLVKTAACAALRSFENANRYSFRALVFARALCNRYTELLDIP